MRIMKGSLCLLLVLLAGIHVWAQSQITTGAIQGTVLDPSNAVVPGASVEVKEVSTNFTRNQSTNGDGRFVFLQLPPGRYTVTVSGKSGFGTVVQENVVLTVGQTISLNVGLKLVAAGDKIVVTDTPTIDVTRIENSNTLDTTTVSTTPILGRKFEDLLTLTPGVAITQGPDGDEINFSGQRGIFNNISLDGGDYNNGFFGEQLGGQRAAIDINLDAVEQFQVIASGASAEFGRTAGGVVNVVSKSGTNNVHGSLFHYQRLEALTSNTSDGKPLDGFHREQFGGSIGGPIKRDKLFFFGSFEQIISNLRRPNLSAQLGATPCAVPTPTIFANEAQIAGNSDCQRLALVNFYKTRFNQEEGLPVNHPIRNSNVFGKVDWNANAKNKVAISYNFDYSRNENQTFDVATYGNSANGIEGPSKIQALNGNLFSTLSNNKLNELHVSWSRENRPRAAVDSKIPMDTGMDFVNAFRFGNPFFLGPTVDEVFWRTQIRDSFSWVAGKHTVKFGGEWMHSDNAQVFRGFFEGRSIFDSVPGFLRYASPAAAGGFGPTTGECLDAAGALKGWVTWGAPFNETCPAGSSVGGPLILYLQGAGLQGPATDAAGFSDIANEDYSLFVQDKWQINSRFTFNYGLRWEAQIMPDPVVPPAKTAYGAFLNNPLFPSDGTLPSPKKEFQPRVGFAWDVAGNGKSVVRANWGIYYGHQNMLSQVGSITTNGVQQQTIFTNSSLASLGFTPTPNAYPGLINPTPVAPGTFPSGTGVRVFDRNYNNPRIYTTSVGFEQELAPDWAVYMDFTHSKGVYLTHFYNANNGFYDSRTGNFVPANTFAPQLGEVMVTSALGKSLYQGFTIGVRKRMSKRFQLEGNYVYSRDRDNDSNERDPFTDRRINPMRPDLDYGYSDRDEPHKFNFFTYADLPWGITANVRMQAHSAQPTTPLGATQRNTARKDNQYFSFDWRASRPIKFGDRYQLVPTVEMFNTFNNKNNVNPLASPALFNFDGFLRQGVGDPRQAQLSVKFLF